MKMTKSMALLVLFLLTLAACSAKPRVGDAGSAAAQTTVAQTEPTKPDAVDELLKNMSLEEKVGQLFYVRCSAENTPDWLHNYHLGGLILFGDDFEGKTAGEVRAEIASYQDNSKTPLLIGVDEEGGTVVRVSDNPNLRSEPFDSPKEIYQNGGWESIDVTEAEKADLLLSLGINVNMAPVCDVTADADSFMYDRSFSGNADEVSTFVTKTVHICKDKKLGTVLKHFPGYGETADTHEDTAVDDKSYERFETVDFLPFKAGIAAGTDCVLVAHSIVSSVDAQTPASLSQKVHDILRGQLGFTGVIMTDDLAMEAIGKYSGADAAAVAAAKCGNDLLCCSDVETQYPAVLSAVKDGTISVSQIDASVRRILKWKQHLGLISQ